MESKTSHRAPPIEHWLKLCAQSEQSGDYLGACDAALLGLEQHPAARELQFRAILNLSRAGANKRAEQLLLRFELRADLDELTEPGDLEENIAALGARIEREQAFAAPAEQRPSKLRKAADHYCALYRQFGSTFLGVNAAVLYELSGASVCAKKIALRILVECNASTPRSRQEAYQLEADRAAATLVLDDFERAAKAIEDAGRLASNAASLSSTRKQLLQICDHKRIDRSIVAPLRNRTVIHYTGHLIAPASVLGRFPAHLESRVAQAIREELDRNNVGYGYGSLACGADTLIVEALLERGAEVEVVLPFELNSFVEESVAIGGADWVDRFTRCIKQVGVICATQSEYLGDSEVFAYASRLAIGLAILRAQQLSSELIQLAVWDGRKTSEQVGTFADIRVWQRYGGKTITIASEGNLDSRVRQSGGGPKSNSSAPPRKLRAIMFGDFYGFSRLDDRQMLTFYDRVLSRIAPVLDHYQPDIAVRNTWGDGLYVVFRDVGAAAHCALEIQAALAELDCQLLNLPNTFGLRLGLDAGPVFEVRDPIVKSLAFTGGHIIRTARLQPSTPPGEVYVTEAFAALFTLLKDEELACEYVGMMEAAKNYGPLRAYLLRQRFR